MDSPVDLSHFQKVFSPGLVDLADEKSSFGEYMKAAVCKIKKARLPALNLQEEFAGAVARVEGLCGKMAEAERQAEMLFQELLMEAFNG